jgi:hypothetical protein
MGVTVPRRWDAVVVLAVALVARMAIVAWAHDRFPAVEDGHYYDVLARRMASGGGYTWLWPDGAVTPAAHYPVGYPAMLSVAYAVFGASGTLAMTLAAALGAAGSYATYRVVDAEAIARWRPLAAGLVVALHPALVPYTAAFMTEGITASLLAVAAATAVRARGSTRAWRWIVLTGVVVGATTLVRPQSLLLAPVLGALALPSTAPGRARLASAALVLGVTLACVAPWTARNCVKMHRCALVSVNGGWNLLIGAQTTTGGWSPILVPPQCEKIWDEAAKDECFEVAARHSIEASPWRWIARSPGKLAATLDYIGAAPWYLHASNDAAFGDDAKLRLGIVETAVCRLLLLAALVSCGLEPGPRAASRKVLALVGAIGALTVHAWIGYVALAATIVALGPRGWWRAPFTHPWVGAVVGSSVLVHAVFFGAGRYGLVVVPFVAAAAFATTAVGADRSRGSP